MRAHESLVVKDLNQEHIGILELLDQLLISHGELELNGHIMFDWMTCRIKIFQGVGLISYI